MLKGTESSRLRKYLKKAEFYFAQILNRMETLNAGCELWQRAHLNDLFEPRLVPVKRWVLQRQQMCRDLWLGPQRNR